MRKREFCDTNGRVVGVVSTIKCIYFYWKCFELKQFHIIVIVGTSVQNTTFKARQCVINFSMVRGEQYKMNCHLMCKIYSMKSIQVGLYPSLFKAMRFLQYTKKLQRFQIVPVTRIFQNTVYRWTVSSIRMGNDEPWNRRLKIGYFAQSQKYKKKTESEYSSISLCPLPGESI